MRSKVIVIHLGNLPLPLFAKEGYIPPFGKGRIGGILQINVFIILRLLIESVYEL